MSNHESQSLPKIGCAHRRAACALGSALGGAVLTGCDFRLGAPEMLWLLWLVPAAALFLWLSRRHERQLLLRFAESALLEKLSPDFSAGRKSLKSILLIVAVASLLFALTEPRLGFTWEEVRRSGVDVVVALDVSDSMLVEDGSSGEQLSRLAQAKRKVQDLLGILAGDRVGLVSFSGAAFLDCPLTVDYGAAAQFVDDLDTESISAKGTDLGSAIRTSLRAFEGGTGDSQAVILITDGEDQAGDAQAAAEEAKRAGVRIFAIGIGRSEGAPIPQTDGGLRRAPNGELVLSRLDEPTLQRIALTTGGTYVRSVTGDVDLLAIYRQGIRGQLATRDFESRHRQRWHERYQWFVALAWVALAAEFLLPDRIRARRKA